MTRSPMARSHAAAVRPDAVALADEAASWRSAYVHIPFCRRRCPYCDFAVVAEAEGGDAATIVRYVDALITEIDRGPSFGPLDAINFGGGTPSAVEPALLGRIVEALAAKYGITADSEVSLEANPEDWSPETGRQWRALGVTRVSWGVQSFDPAVLRSLGRAHDPQQAAAAVAGSIEVGGLSVGLDLIFGTPGETAASWRSSVERALSHGIDHCSAYALTVEKGTALYRAVAGGAPAPDPDVQADRYEALLEAVASSPLIRYETSNFAKPGHVCRYNLATWGRGEYLGFGLGAHSHVAGVRWWNVRRIDGYVAAVEAGRPARAGEERLEGWEADQERLVLGLRRAAGVELGTVGRYLVASEAGGALVEAGVVTVDDGRLVVRRPLLGDEVARAVLSVTPGDC